MIMDCTQGFLFKRTYEVKNEDLYSKVFPALSGNFRVYNLLMALESNLPEVSEVDSKPVHEP